MMSNYVTIVLRMPANENERRHVNQALDALGPYKIAMSLEDEMTVLELIEQHEDFDASIASQAREQAAIMHAKTEQAAS